MTHLVLFLLPLILLQSLFNSSVHAVPQSLLFFIKLNQKKSRNIDFKWLLHNSHQCRQVIAAWDFIGTNYCLSDNEQNCFGISYVFWCVGAVLIKVLGSHSCESLDRLCPHYKYIPLQEPSENPPSFSSEKNFNLTPLTHRHKSPNWVLYFCFTSQCLHPTKLNP